MHVLLESSNARTTIYIPDSVKGISLHVARKAQQRAFRGSHVAERGLIQTTPSDVWQLPSRQLESSRFDKARRTIVN